MHNESSASGQAPEEEGPGRRVQRSRSAQARLSQWNSIRLVCGHQYRGLHATVKQNCGD